MTELRTLHVTDLHDDWEKYEVIAKYVAGKKGSEQAIDAVFITGDFIEGDPQAVGKTAYRIDTEVNTQVKEKLKPDFDAIQAVLKKYVEDGKIDLAKVDKPDQEKIKEFEAKSAAATKEILNRKFQESYQKHAEALAKIDTLIFGILGNHDLTSGYEILKDKVTFVEKTNKASVKGKNGLEFTIKGDLNTWEFPAFYSKIGTALSDLLIPYQSGYSLSELSRQVNQLQAEVADGQSERLEKIAKKEEPKYSEEQLKEMQAKFEYFTELRKEVLAYNQSELQRLGDKQEAIDIYFTHKLPGCKKARPDTKGPLSDLTFEYAANARTVCGGHFHDGQVGYKTIENLLKPETAETTTIDGVEVPVYYLDENEPWELNPGTNHFFVTEYDANKQVEQVVIHEFYYEETA